MAGDNPFRKCRSGPGQADNEQWRFVVVCFRYVALEPGCITAFDDFVDNCDIVVDTVFRNAANGIAAALIILECFVPLLQILLFLSQRVIKENISIDREIRFTQDGLHLLNVAGILRTIEARQQIVISLMLRVLRQ